MINIEDKSVRPSVEELCEYVEAPLFRELRQIMADGYSASECVEYSGDRVLLGWNLKYKKAGRTLCTVYPRKGHFPMLLIVGRKEKERVEMLLPSLSPEFARVYNETREGMGQRWLMFDFRDKTAAFDDVLKIIRIRRESK